VTSAVEHSAVLNATAYGATDVVQVPVDRTGRVEVEAFADAVRAYGTAIACRALYRTSRRSWGR
jgi:cysteine desulfurase